MTARRDKLDELLVKAHELPAVPGVYLMKDPAGVVLYVGKASNLPDRVSSYFVPSADLGPKKQPMLELVDDFDVIECEGEWEALLTENRLIKDIHPRFNAPPDRRQELPLPRRDHTRRLPRRLHHPRAHGPAVQRRKSPRAVHERVRLA